MEVAISILFMKPSSMSKSTMPAIFPIEYPNSLVGVGAISPLSLSNAQVRLFDLLVFQEILPPPLAYDLAGL